MNFISESAGGLENVKDLISSTSAWRELLAPFVGDLEPNSNNVVSVVASLSEGNEVAFSWHVHWLIEAIKSDGLGALKDISIFDGIAVGLMAVCLENVRVQSGTHSVKQNGNVSVSGTVIESVFNS